MEATDFRPPFDGLPVLSDVCVLMVDDPDAGREALAHALEGLGAEVLVAGTAAEGFDIVRSAKPDVLLGDVAHLGGAGYDLLRMVRSLSKAEGGATPAVALGTLEGGDAEAALAAGYQAYLPKPVPVARLAEVIARLGRQVSETRELRARATAQSREQRRLRESLEARRREVRADNEKRSAARRGGLVVAQPSEAGENRLLDALPPEDWARVARLLEPVALLRGQTLFRPGEPIDDVYFPRLCLVSSLCLAESGRTVEVSQIGRFGVVGYTAALGASTATVWARVQVGGPAWRLSAGALVGAMDENDALRKTLLGHAGLQIAEMSQAVVCNRLHLLEAQLASWLLRASLYLGSNRLPMTQEEISSCLGSRRAGISVAAGGLAKAGLIRSSRGVVTVVDRPGLEAVACECYATIRGEYDRLLGAQDRYRR